LQITLVPARATLWLRHCRAVRSVVNLFPDCWGPMGPIGIQKSDFLAREKNGDSCPRGPGFGPFDRRYFARRQVWMV
jgi:hypothetical protein